MAWPTTPPEVTLTPVAFSRTIKANQPLYSGGSLLRSAHHAL